MGQELCERTKWREECGVMLTLFILKDGLFDISVKFILRLRVGVRTTLSRPHPDDRPQPLTPRQQRPAAPPDTRGC
jgi:hypothetical protein